MIILTGSKGFIGRNFKAKLSSDVVEVDKDNCWKFLQTFDRWSEVALILHQGAISATTETNIESLHKCNVSFTLQLFELAAKYGIPVKYASSASVYGNTSDQMNPLNFYAISKLQIDYFVQDNIHKFPLIQGFRYFNVYGDGEDDKGDQSSPVSKFARQVKQTNQLTLFEGSEKILRDFIWVGDLVNIVLNNTKPSGVYDLGTSNPVSFQHVAECVVEKFGGTIKQVPFPKHLAGKYQAYTCAKREWEHYKFISVKEYLS